MSEAERMRLFVALEVPEAAKRELIAAQEELRRSVGAARVRWTNAAQLHRIIFRSELASEGARHVVLARIEISPMDPAGDNPGPPAKP